MYGPGAKFESPEWQWSLRDLLTWTAYASALCATIVFFGIDGSPFLALFLFFSLVMTASIGIPGILMVPVLAIVCFIGVAFFSIPLLANCAIHTAFVVWKKLGNREVSRKVAMHVSLISLFVSIAGVAVFGLGPYRDLMELRERFPRQDQAQRLKYERKRDREAKLKFDVMPPRLSDRWKDFELTLLTELGAWPEARNHYLRQIHDKEVESFVKAQGFGVSRMAFYQNLHGGVLPELVNVPFQFAEKNRPQTFYEGNYWITAQWRYNDEPLDFHFSGLLDFLNTTTYGLTVEPLVTIGFEPHAFHFPAEPVTYQNAKLNLSSLQLVSLRRFDKPRVYVLDHLPRMDQLQGDKVATRDLTDIESKFLKNIQTNNEDVVFEFSEHTLIMLGSIRAVQSCLECHTARRGALIGALSYRFDEIQEVNQK